MQYKLHRIWKAASVICNNTVFFLLRLDSVREQLCLFEDTLFHWSMSLSFDESQSVCPENYNFRLLPNETFTLLNVKPLLDELSRCSYALDQFPMP
jgi:hypothetical protein